MTFYDFLQCVTWCAASILLACIINPFVFLVVAPLLAGFVRLRRFFLKTSREVKRLDAVSRSPIYSSLSETLAGLVAVRAFVCRWPRARLFAATDDGAYSLLASEYATRLDPQFHYDKAVARVLPKLS